MVCNGESFDETDSSPVHCLFRRPKWNEYKAMRVNFEKMLQELLQSCNYVISGLHKVAEHLLPTRVGSSCTDAPTHIDTHTKTQEYMGNPPIYTVSFYSVSIDSDRNALCQYIAALLLWYAQTLNVQMLPVVPVTSLSLHISLAILRT